MPVSSASHASLYVEIEICTVSSGQKRSYTETESVVGPITGNTTPPTIYMDAKQSKTNKVFVQSFNSRLQVKVLSKCVCVCVCVCVFVTKGFKSRTEIT